MIIMCNNNNNENNSSNDNDIINECIINDINNVLYY